MWVIQSICIVLCTSLPHLGLWSFWWRKANVISQCHVDWHRPGREEQLNVDIHKYKIVMNGSWPGLMKHMGVLFETTWIDDAIWNYTYTFNFASCQIFRLSGTWIYFENLVAIEVDVICKSGHTDMIWEALWAKYCCQAYDLSSGQELYYTSAEWYLVNCSFL